MEQITLPALDMDALSAKAYQFAMDGAISELKEFYSGYNSPFKKKIREYLDDQQPSIHFEIPNIIAEINKGLCAEVERIANNSIAESFIPLLSEALVKVPKQLKLSDMLKQFIKCVEFDIREHNVPTIEIDEDAQFGWLNIVIYYYENRNNKIQYEFTLHLKNKSNKVYNLFSLPRAKAPSNYTKMIKLSDGSATLELPFTSDILKDKFTAYMANIIICKSDIEIDCDDFESVIDHEYED